MKTLLVAMNSQYIHENLAVWYLKAACSEYNLQEIKVLQFSINESLAAVYGKIIREKPDVVAFSCYIWNIEQVIRLAEDIKKADAGIVIIAGGPEVSFDDGGLIHRNTNFDFYITGEAEEKLPDLLHCLEKGKTPDMDKLQEYSVIENLGSLPSPYEGIQKGALAAKIAYIEASRGCPFRCAYCISSKTGSVRFFPLDSVYQGIFQLVQSGTKMIKFVDRTFNANEDRAITIWEHIRKYADNNVTFHFEVDPGILSDKMLYCLSQMPPGLIQIEAGIQSTHEKTLQAVKRPYQVDKALHAIEGILKCGNIHVHVDLIAGLPYEGYEQFAESFNRVYTLFSHHFQMGFLKLLRGCDLRKHYSVHAYTFRSYPPYEILSNQYIDAPQLLQLKDIEACLELFYNSGRMASTLKALDGYFQTDEHLKMSPFHLYEKLAQYMRENGYLDHPMKSVDLYRVMLHFIQKNFPGFLQRAIEHLRFDYYVSMKNPSLPPVLQKEGEIYGKKGRIKEMLRFQNQIQAVLPRLRTKSMQEIGHQIVVETFCLQGFGSKPENLGIVIDFGDISPVTHLARAYPLG